MALPFDASEVEAFRASWGLHPQLAVRVLELYVLCWSKGIPLRVLEGHRSLGRQAELYAQGRTKPGPIVTNAKPGQSKHNAYPSRAVDLHFPAEHTRTVGELGERLGLTWGGRWTKPYDPPHFQWTGP